MLVNNSIKFQMILSYLQKDESTANTEFDKNPTEDDFEYIKLISNGAYG